MSDADRDPHVLVSARAAEHPKIIELPNDRARWGWVVLLGKAKLQRPPGRFASLRVVEAVMGDFRRYVTDYLRVGILERGDGRCERCAVVIPDAKPDEIVVHDWAENQSRTQRWRRENGLTSGHHNLTPGNTGETLGETPGKQPHAGARALQSQSVVVLSGGEGVGEGEDAVLALHARTGTFPSSKVVTWVNEIAGRHGEDRVAAAFRVTPMDGRTVPDYIRAVVDGLRAQDHAAERTEAAAEKARLEEKRRPSAIRVAAPDVSPEEAERIAREYRAAERERLS
jgi:hypothetical protein